MRIVRRMVEGHFNVVAKKRATRLVIGTNNMDEGEDSGYIQVAKITLEDGTMLEQHKMYVKDRIYPKTTYTKLNESTEIEVQFIEENHVLEEIFITYLSTEEQINKLKLGYISKLKEEVNELFSLYSQDRTHTYTSKHRHESLLNDYDEMTMDQLNDQMVRYLIDCGFHELGVAEECRCENKKEVDPVFTEDFDTLVKKSTFIGKSLKKTGLIILNRLALNEKYKFLEKDKDYSKKEQQEIDCLKRENQSIIKTNFGLAPDSFIRYMELKNGNH